MGARGARPSPRGSPRAGDEEYQRHGRVFIAKNAEQVREQLVGDWFCGIERGDAVMVAAGRDDVADLNGRARAFMRANNLLGQDTH